MPVSQEEINKIMTRARVAQKQAQPSQTSGRGGPLTAFISELGGTGGALGGAALGSALLPGIGTLLGAALGGFAGGTGGKAIEQKVRDDQDFFGEGGSAREAFTEGTIEGILSAGPIKLLKAGGKLGSAGIKGGAAGLASANSELAEQLTKGLISSGGAKATGAARGIRTGVKASGDRIGASTAKELNEFLTKRVGIKKGSASAQQEALEKFIKNQNDELADAIRKSNRALRGSEKVELVSKLQDEFGGILGKSGRQQTFIDDIVQRVQDATDIKDLDDLRKLIDKGIPDNKFGDATLSQQQDVLMRARNLLTSEVADKARAVKGLKKDLSQALTAQDLLLQRAGAVGSGLSPAGLTLPGSAAQAAQARIGQGMTALGGALDSLGPRAMATRTGIGSLLAPNLNEEQVALDQQAQVDQEGAALLEDVLAGLQEQTQAQQVDTGMPSRDEIIQAMVFDLQETGGQGMEVLSQMLELSELASQSASQDPNITKVTAQQFGLAETGMQALDALEQMIQEDPSLVTRQITPGRQLPLVGGFISEAAGTGEVDALTFNIADTLLRLRTGAQANEEEVRKLQTQLMPRPGDSPATIQTKLQQLRAAFGGVLNQAGVQ